MSYCPPREIYISKAFYPEEGRPFWLFSAVERQDDEAAASNQRRRESGHRQDVKVWLEKLAAHVPTKALYVIHV